MQNCIEGGKYCSHISTDGTENKLKLNKYNQIQPNTGLIFGIDFKTFSENGLRY